LNQLTTVVQGPATFIRKDYEEVVAGPLSNIQIPPNSYVSVTNPVVLVNGAPQKDKYGCYKLQYGETEIRTYEQWQDSFPLYPGEVNQTPKPKPYVVINKDSHIKIKVLRPYTSDSKSYVTGELYQLSGPMTYIPRKEEEFVEIIKKVIVKPNEALNILAKEDFVDQNGVQRKTGEHWLYDVQGSYWPGVHEVICSSVKAHVLTDKRALHISALNAHTDQFGVERKAGEVWLVTNDMTATFLPNVHQKLVEKVQSITLSNREYMKVTNPYCQTSKNLLRGRSEIRFGEKTFFKYPGELLEDKQTLTVLSEEQSMVLMAIQEFEDSENKVNRQPGEKWLKRGPGEYHPSTKVRVLDTRFDLALDSSEGVYIRD
jgi:major vault protein